MNRTGDQSAETMIEATCHCGNVSATIRTLPASLVSCNCSICRRLGALWAYYSPSDVKLTVRDGDTATYVWGPGYIAFHHCPTCGCTTHYTSTGKTKGERVGLNCRMLDPGITEALPIRYFDGADSWQFID